jgi:hypothetical protein
LYVSRWQRERRAFVDGVDRIADAGAQHDIVCAAGELLRDRGAALREIDLDIKISAAKKPFCVAT